MRHSSCARVKRILTELDAGSAVTAESARFLGDGTRTVRVVFSTDAAIQRAQRSIKQGLAKLSKYMRARYALYLDEDLTCLQQAVRTARRPTYDYLRSQNRAGKGVLAVSMVGSDIMLLKRGAQGQQRWVPHQPQPTREEPLRMRGEGSSARAAVAAVHGYQHFAYTRGNSVGGGVSDYVDHGLHRFVTHLQCTLATDPERQRAGYRDADFAWLRINKQCLGMPQDIQLCAAYLPPQHTDADGRLHVERLETALRSIEGPSDSVILTGDLNAHSGQLPDIPDQTLLEAWVRLYRAFKLAWAGRHIRASCQCGQTASQWSWMQKASTCSTSSAKGWAWWSLMAGQSGTPALRVRIPHRASPVTTSGPACWISSFSPRPSCSGCPTSRSVMPHIHLLGYSRIANPKP